MHTVEREQHQQRMRKEDFTAVSGRQAAGQRTVTMEETTKEMLLEEDDWGVLCNLSQTALRFGLNDHAIRHEWRSGSAHTARRSG